MQYQNKVSFLVSGRYALFSDPLTRVGGEKTSYQIPTYEALRGILESVYWKPTLSWIIDRVRVLNVIQTQSKGARPIKYGGGNDLSIYTYLKDVAYQVEAHFEWNLARPELEADRNEDKHFQIANRMIERGGRRDVFLGTRECQAYVEPCQFGEGQGAYDGLAELDFGVMLHGLTYPPGSQSGPLKVRLWRPVMCKGIIDFPRPEDCTMVQELKTVSGTAFTPGKNFSYCDALWEEVSP
ncbi:MAG: type I-C CRISPR-associated protein Cas5c [Oscillospiraceae bacterium]